MTCYPGNVAGILNLNTMALYGQGILGCFSGRIGNVIGTFWKGRNVMRIRAAHVLNPNTLRQQMQRLKFKLISAFVKAQMNLIKVGFSAVDKTVTPYNSALKYNVARAITGIFPAYSIDFSKVVISIGTLLGIKSAVLSSTVSGTVSIDWLDNSANTKGFETDYLMVAAIEEASGEMMTFTKVARRNDEEASLSMPESWSGKSVRIIVFFVTEGGAEYVYELEQVSTSEYLGSIIVA